jgi:hypothetical protein
LALVCGTTLIASICISLFSFGASYFFVSFLKQESLFFLFGCLCLSKEKANLRFPLQSSKALSNSFSCEEYVSFSISSRPSA